MVLNLSDYDYSLPEEKIAKFPLNKREDSNLLVFNAEGISHDTFKNIKNHVPQHSLLVFNNTKVIPARIFFTKATGASIEIFLLNPVDPVDLNLVMQERRSCTWNCIIGNLKKWKDNDPLLKEVRISEQNLVLTARLKDREKGEVEFDWNFPEVSFADILDKIGEVPLPPYLKRKPTAEDKPRYQTVYSQNDGAVAAPTAGLHFTTTILEELKSNRCKVDYLTLHVSAGTFQPIKDENVLDHPMHSEVIIIQRSNILNLLEPKFKTIAVGTTSMRTLESLYWFGVKLLLKQNVDFKIQKLEPYEYDMDLPSKEDALKSVLDYMNKIKLDVLYGSTEIFIFPGYKFKICEGLITNFHMPKSTLILLIAAFVGEEKWRLIYKEALCNNYRFLSYGDSSLLLP